MDFCILLITGVVIWIGSFLYERIKFKSYVPNFKGKVNVWENF